jgi:pyruvate dehydrogenase E2 component (dihydrolipoamide acetyltransferase)
VNYERKAPSIPAPPKIPIHQARMALFGAGGRLVIGDPAAVAAKTPAAVKASKSARKLAQQRKLDLSRIRGTGPGGSIQKVDVERASGLP